MELRPSVAAPKKKGRSENTKARETDSFGVAGGCWFVVLRIYPAIGKMKTFKPVRSMYDIFIPVPFFADFDGECRYNRFEHMAGYISDVDESVV